MKLRNLLITIALLLIPAQVFAVNEDLHSIRYGSQFFAAGDSFCPDNTIPAPPGRDNIESVWNNLIAKGLKPFQVAGIMGNMQSESHFDPTIIQGGKHSLNPSDAGGGGYGLVQWTPGSKLVPYLHGKTPDIPNEINALWDQLTGVGPSSEKAAGDALRASTTIEAATDTFELKYERHAGNPQPLRLKQAKAILALATQKGWTSASEAASGPTTPVNATDCPGGNGAVAGDIIKTAVGYAWPFPKDSRTDIPPSYKTVNVNPGGNDPFTDCGTFVATVMITSGVDRSYPHVDTGAQLSYLNKHPEKYQIIHPKSTADLQPGDILVFHEGSKGHTMFYLGAQGGKYPRVDASWHDHTPQMGDIGGVNWMFSRGATAARVKK